VRERRRDRDPQVVGELPLRHLDPRHRLPDAVGHQHTLRSAGGAAGVHDRAQVLRAHVGCLERGRLELVGERQVVVADVVGPEAEQGEVRVPRLQLGGAFTEVVRVEHEALDLGVTDHVRVVGKRAHRVQRCQDTTVDQRRRQVGEDLRPVLRQHREARALVHTARPLGLQHLTGPLSDLGVRRDPTGEVDARRIVVGSEATNDQVRQQRRVVKGRGHGGMVVRRHRMFPMRALPRRHAVPWAPAFSTCRSSCSLAGGTNDAILHEATLCWPVRCADHRNVGGLP
jgi:hypothetical protein